MNITVCGSIAFFNEMLDVKNQLERLGHQVKIPPVKIPDEHGNLIPVTDYYAKRKAETDDKSWIWDKKEQAMRLHFQKVEWCDAVLILNYTKNGIQNYIGANTLLEMGLAFHLTKKIFLLNAIPDISYKEEILGMKPIIIGNDLGEIIC